MAPRSRMTLLILAVLAGCDRAEDSTKSAAIPSEDPPAAPAGADPPREQLLPGIDRAKSAELVTPQGRTRCKDMIGSLDDRDPAGRIVRSAPRADAPEVGRLLPPHEVEEWNPLPAEFSVLGSENGWLEIEGGGFDAQLYGAKPPTMYSGRGWIAGGGVSIKVQSQRGFAAPDHASPVLIALSEGSDFDGAAQVRTVACDGRWILADWRFRQGEGPPWNLDYRPEAVIQREPLTLRAWVTGVCNIRETTCDGVNGSRAETSRLDGDP